MQQAVAEKQIGTAIFRYVGVPQFDSAKQGHKRIAEISKQAHAARANSLSTDDLDEQTQKQLDDLVLKAF